MKKPKVKMDSAKIKAFFLNHVEKILLVGVVGLMLLLLWQGLNLTGVKPDQTPQKLLTNSTSMRTFIDDPNRWKDIESERVKPYDMDIGPKVAVTHLRTDSSQYFLPNPLKRADFPKLAPRTDPQLFPPTHLVVHPIIGPLAAIWAIPTEPDPLTVAAATTAARPAPKPPSKKKKAAEDVYNPNPDALAGMPPKKSKKTKGPMGSEASPGEVGMGSAPGFIEGGSGMMGSELMNADANAIGWTPSQPDATIARNTRAMVITAVVPFEKQVEEFLNTLGTSLDYEQARDFPQYLNFGVERADVTADPAAAADALKWTAINVNKAIQEQLVGVPTANPPVPPIWAGQPVEVVDPAYLDPLMLGGHLTHPVPPFLQRDLWSLLTHPDVPLATQNQYGTGESGPGLPGGQAPSPVDDSPIGGLPIGTALGGAGGEMYSQPGFGGARGSGMPGMGSAGAPAMGGGMRAPMMTDSTGQPMIAPSKFKLIRFTDTTIELNHKYRYRLKVYLNDPNHPPLPDPTRQSANHMPPSVASLHDSVQKRIKLLDAKDAEETKRRGKPWRTYWVESPWSEPSDVVELPPTGQFLAHSVTPPATAKMGTFSLANDQPKASVVAVKWDPTKVADIPAELDKVYRGTVFNFTQELTKVIHPVTKQVVELAKEKFATGALVADLSGGEKIPALDKVAEHQLVTPGEVLIFDAFGNLHVQNEVLDIDVIRRVTVKKPDPAAAAAAAGAEGGGLMPDGSAGPPGSRPARGSKSKTGCF